MLVELPFFLGCSENNSEITLFKSHFFYDENRSCLTTDLSVTVIARIDSMTHVS